MKRLLTLALILGLFAGLQAEGDGGQYRLYGKAYDSTGIALRHEVIMFIVRNDTIKIKTDSLGNFETKITWRTFDQTLMTKDTNVQEENEKMNPPIMVIWSNKLISIHNRWEEAQYASYKGNWVDRPHDLYFK